MTEKEAAELRRACSIIGAWKKEREARRIAGYKLGALRSGEKSRRDKESRCIALTGQDESKLRPRERTKALAEGRRLMDARLSAIKNVRKRVHTERLRLAMPAWADRAAMDAIYTEAALLTAGAGKPYEVDHIVPLLGKTVSGLHVEYNLRIVPRTVNRRKCNKLIAVT